MFSKVISKIGHFLFEEKWMGPYPRPHAVLKISTIVLLSMMISTALFSCKASNRFDLVPIADGGEFHYVTEYHFGNMTEYSFAYFLDEGKHYASLSSTSENVKLVYLKPLENRPYVEMSFTEDGQPDLDSIVLHLNGQADINFIYPSLSLEDAFAPNDDPGPGPGPVDCATPSSESATPA